VRCERDEIQQIRENLSAATLAQLRAEAVAEVRLQFGGSYKVKESGPVVEAFLNGLIRERYVESTALAQA
jgi:hypothetical protein